MRTVNLLTLSQGFRAVPYNQQAAYEAQLSERDEPLSIIKSHESSSLCQLVDNLRAKDVRSPQSFEGFVFSFRIPQISAEFDLLKLCDSSLVNIELKSKDVGMQRLRRQLVRNRYYLAPLERRTSLFSFVASENTLFELMDSDDVRRVGFDRLKQVLEESSNAYEGAVEDLFKVGNYLVSPLNDTRKFLEGSYFLTNHQAQIKASFLTACAEADSSTFARPPVFLVYGSAGTGKTLLLYDIAKALGTMRPTRVIHCGLLTQGHNQLNDGQSSFHVVSARGSEQLSLEGFGAVLVDEAQRMWPDQLRRITEQATKAQVPLYLSLDRRQLLSQRPESHDSERIVRQTCPHASVWELSRKIRTNRELVGFIRALFSLHGSRGPAPTQHVKIACGLHTNDARELLDAFRMEGYQCIAFDATPRVAEPLDGFDVSGFPSTSMVVGQEFDKVAMSVGPRFSMKDELHRQLLYQGLTRARSDIAIVVHQNDEFLTHVLAIVAASI